MDIHLMIRFIVPSSCLFKTSANNESKSSILDISTGCLNKRVNIGVFT